MMRRIALMLGLALGDLLLTHCLLTRENSSFYESNPIAQWMLVNFGWLGMGLWKLFTIAIVVSVVVVLARSRPRTSGRLLNLGVSAQFLVVMYSLFLLSAPPGRKPLPELPSLEQQEQMHEFRAHLAVLVRRVAVEGHNLEGAVDQLASLSRMSDPEWRSWLQQNYPENSLKKSLRRYFLQNLKLSFPQQSESLDSQKQHPTYKNSLISTGTF